MSILIVKVVACQNIIILIAATVCGSTFMPICRDMLQLYNCQNPCPIMLNRNAYPALKKSGQEQSTKMPLAGLATYSNCSIDFYITLDMLCGKYLHAAACHFYNSTAKHKSVISFYSLFGQQAQGVIVMYKYFAVFLCIQLPATYI